MKDFTNLSDPKGATPDSSCLRYCHFYQIRAKSSSDWRGLRLCVPWVSRTGLCNAV